MRPDLRDPAQQADLLIVDDTPENLRLLTALLTQHGYKARAAASGARGLAAAQARPPDLILLDIRMPDMDGYTVCEQLRADPRTQDIPVLFISALSDTEDKVRGFDAGAVDYVTKPFQARELLARVETHLTLRRLQRGLERQIAERDRLIAELDAYAHTVAHDLKNPLSTLAGYADLLYQSYESLSNEDVGDFAMRMSHSAHKLTGIVNSLLLLASVRHEGVPLERLDMPAIVQSALQRHGREIERRTAVVDPPTVWPEALGYAPWVEEVWDNYISNALKYGGRASGEERVPPHITLGGTALPGGQVRFWVQDNGAGIAAEDQAQLFLPFARLSQRGPNSHGLGLSIVQRIVERLGGQVACESQPGCGSVFSFILPAAP